MFWLTEEFTAAALGPILGGTNAKEFCLPYIERPALIVWAVVFRVTIAPTGLNRTTLSDRLIRTVLYRPTAPPTLNICRLPVYAVVMVCYGICRVIPRYEGLHF